jgi:hypothetical protein
VAMTGGPGEDMLGRRRHGRGTAGLNPDLIRIVLNRFSGGDAQNADAH